MKNRVFWKILYGYWMTTILFSQVVWLLFNLLRPEQPVDTTPQRSVSIVVVAAAATIKEHGMAVLQRNMQTWPPFFRSQLVIAPAGPQATGTVLVVSQGDSAEIEPVGGVAAWGLTTAPFEIVSITTAWP